MNSLTNRVAIITGGAQGIGRACVDVFLEAGARIAIWDINIEQGQAVVDELKVKGYDIRFYSVNTVDLDQTIAAAATVHKDFGQIDILINNAGITRDASLKKITPEQWQQVIAVNLTGVFNCTKAVHPYMKEGLYGRIVNASSVVGIQGNFGQTNYVATKSGVIGLTKVWARELGRYGITVNAVAPGFIVTEMTKTIPEKILENFRSKTPLGRMGTPTEVAKLYCFLASEDASYITGTTVSVDGGVRI